MKTVIAILGATTLATAVVVAQAQKTPPPTPPAKMSAPVTNPLVASTRFGYDTFKGYLVKAADQMTDYNFKPAGVAAEVRTFGQIIGHLAEENPIICGAAANMPPPASLKDAEKMLKTKAELTKGLAEAFAFCDKVWASTTDANAATPIDLPFNMGKNTRLGTLAFNAAHDGEHYGNIVTYMRAKGLVPPSSQK